jgi:hypothetical protein
MPGKRITDLTALSGANSANNDDLVIFDATASETKRISRSQLAEGMQADVQVLSNKTLALGSNTVTGTTAQFNTALTDNNFATQAGSEVLTNKTINARTNTLQGSDASRLHWFKDVAALLADTTLVAATGDVVQTREEGFAYEVVTSGQHVTTAGGVKLIVLPGDAGMNVKAFGAKGDGTTSDTVAIQAAINSLADSSSDYDPARYANGGGTVYFPDGNYKITSPIAITHNVTLIGSSSGGSKISASTNIDLIQIGYISTGVADYGIVSPSIRNLQLDGGGSAEAAITNRYGAVSNPVTHGLFEDLAIYGCKVGIHFFGGWNNTFRNIQIRSDDYNATTSEGIIGIIGETVTVGNTYGPTGHQVVAQVAAGGFNNNIFDTVVTVYMRRIGVHIRAISAAHSYANKFINCNFEQILKQGTPQTYAPYTDTTATPEGLTVQTLKWQGQAVGLHLLGRIAAFSVDDCYFEAIANSGSTTDGVGISLDDCGIVFGGGASKAYSNSITENFFNSNCEMPVLVGRAQQTTISTNAILLAAGGGYFVDSGATQTLFVNELFGNVDTSSTGRFGWVGGNAGIGLNDPARSNAFVTVNTGSLTGVDIYRAGSTVNFNGIRFRDGTNASDFGRIGWNSGSIRHEALSSFDFYINNTRNLFADATRLFPNPDNTMSLGVAGNRWTTVFATTGTINTSDQNEKQDIAALNAAELATAAALKGMVKKFRFKDAVETKGDQARIHVGVIAQEVKAAFEANGLDASEYGIFCSDTWTDEDTGEEKTRLGVRYEELLAFIIAAL